MAKSCKNQSDLPDMSERLDRLSYLHVPLLHHVLSFLQTQDVVRTCVLSKKWRKIWCSVPTLNLSEDSFVTEEGNDKQFGFVRFVDSVLILRDASSIHKFHLSRVNWIDDIKVNVWIRYALTHNVEVLDIARVFDLTHIFTCKSLRECRLSCIYAKLPASICLPSLKVLHLEDIDILDGKLDEPFFSAIPSLETFILFHNHSDGLMSRTLTISSHQLRNFKVVGRFPYSIEITAPNLVTFELKFGVHVQSAFRSNCDAMFLSDAIVDVKANSSESMAQLIGIVKNARRLELSFCSLLAFEELQRDLSIQNCFQTPCSNLKWLKIATCFGEDEFLLIKNMLEHSPEIETIVFANKMKDKKFCVNPVDNSKSKQVWGKHKFNHLKLVKIQDFHGSENEVRMLRFFLENAIVLDKVVVEVTKFEESNSINNNEMAELGAELVAYPRASSSVGILFLQKI